MSVQENVAGIPDVLARIVAREHEVVAEAKRVQPIERLREAPLYGSPRRSLRAALEGRRPAVIAECKRRSPSRGVLREPYDPVGIAREYAAAGAAAISVLTNEDYFGGSLADLSAVRAAVSIPVLRKDFMIDAYQLEEAKAAGADAILLIAAVLSEEQLTTLTRAARELALDVLVEVHAEDELARALACGAGIIGINNRDLRTFHTDLATSERLASRVPRDRVLVAESGLRDRDDLARLERSGIGAFLVGEAFMAAPSPGNALRAMLGHAEALA